MEQVDQRTTTGETSDLSVDQDDVELTEEGVPQPNEASVPLAVGDADVDENETAASLDPPASCGEDFRDFLLRFLDRVEFQILGIIVLIVIIADGALFFFLLMGWQTLCDDPSRTDCQPRNDVYNISIQILNGCFTYMAVISMPWRSTQFIHITGWSCPYRSHAIGHDIYGMETTEIWYYISRGKRTAMCIFLLGNCFAQFINQGTRIWYSRFTQQDEAPGNIWTNVFFFLSMAFAAIAGAWQAYEENQIRKKNPGVFNPGPLNQFREYMDYPIRKMREYLNYPCFCCCKNRKPNRQEEPTERMDIDEEDAEEGEEGTETTPVPSVRLHEEHHSYHGEDHTHWRGHPVLPLDRTGMRLWAM